MEEKTTQQPEVKEQTPTATQEVKQPEQEEKPKKKSKWWRWLIVALVVLGIGAAIWYFFFSGVETAATEGVQNFVAQATAPKPPALPN